MAERIKNNNLALRLIFLRYQRPFSFAVVILVLLLSYFLILAPKYEQVGVGGSYNLSAVKAEVNKRQDYLNNLNELINDYQKISQADVGRIKNVLPADKDVAGLFVQLQEIAEKNNLLLASVNINETPEAITAQDAKSQIKQISVNLGLVNPAVNSYQKIKNFLSDLELNLRLFDISAVYFTPGDKTFSVNLVTYYLGQN
ncbi:MAG: hypothetical protein A2729_03015 [Candidatus Buchananbacteria bacterium RIFCSPHIGHO2_01_FULL_39_14]|uniref:Uncharacterized protein n=2 Tax=Candidatus Buchananiibacteriota TaxID=1817903 RepID=A0A1G1YUC6_9BACT|nr:MAG: hypothetical protein A2729_03015 [Candidatus Buchananbacteria bacterium RIFCSPHIGHO2_01_FULL_39_14]OGY49001.1 MAG: hypothetical protein A3D39_01360 [Candidatus Buchananbacteria bacterium RIFCSPHIGHO2_02_FULL_39_17]OGY55963.1 MAG: hypothetical protein A2912_03205 [Candidatus Buchananbacteria bacterium RIFCSPLOWO2_01_FULL_40_23b]